MLRTAGSLRAAKIPAQKINRTLREIRDSLPGELPLSGLSIVAVGDRIVVREGQSLRESDTGQYTLALEFVDQGGDLLVIDKRSNARVSAADEAPSAERRVRRAWRTTSRRRSRSRTPTPRRRARSIEACLAADAQHPRGAAQSRAVSCTWSGRLEEAEQSLSRQRSGEAASFVQPRGASRGPRARVGEAMAAYRHALALDPGFADAHFNLARLHERAGQSEGCAAPSARLPAPDERGLALTRASPPRAG